MGKTYKTEMDINTLKKIFSKKPNCKECRAKVKIYKEKVFEGHGKCEMKGYLGDIDTPKGLINKRKQILFNQDVYEVNNTPLANLRLDEVGASFFKTSKARSPVLAHL